MPTFLSEVAERLGRALDEAGYSQRSFLGVPNGFALATQLERVRPDGEPDVDRRWLQANDDSLPFTLEGYIKRLIFADAGRYRLVIFVVTDQSFAASGPDMSSKDATELTRKGTVTLPTSIAEISYSAQHRCTALVYEFKKTKAVEPEFVLPSPLSGREHLVKARMWAALQGAR